MTKQGWSERDVPDQSGRVAVVTGANSGLGFETSRVLAERGAHLVMACRDAGRAAAARDAIVARHPAAAIDVIALDLASLGSVRGCAEALAKRHERIDLLVNNAGVMRLPARKTNDGFEMQLGTNHLGHFALTGLLLDRLLAAPAARIVTLSSTMHRPGRIQWDDLQSERRYGKWRAYSQSKLANLLFSYELDRRLRRKSARAISVAAHPGYAATNLQSVGARMEGARGLERFFEFGNRLLSQDAAMGALPTLYAATAADVAGGQYYGPSSFGELWGAPRLVASSRRANDAADAARLWEVSVSLTGVGFEALT